MRVGRADSVLLLLVVLIPATLAANRLVLEGADPELSLRSSSRHGKFGRRTREVSLRSLSLAASRTNVASVASAAAAAGGVGPTVAWRVTWRDWALGGILLAASTLILHVNEGRNAKMEGLIARGEAECRGAGAQPGMQREQQYHLTHRCGPMRAAAKVSDPDFGVVFERNCVRLKRTVELFQVIQHKSRRGDTAATFTYTEEWSSRWHESSEYGDVAKRVNTRPQSLKPGAHTETCVVVEFGQDFVLPTPLLEQCAQYQSAQDLVGDEVTCTATGDKLKLCRNDGYYYHAHQKGEDKVGDVRIRFEYVPDGVVTVLALQVDVSDLPEGNSKSIAFGPVAGKGSFLPYRPNGRGSFLAQEEERRRLLEAAKGVEDDPAEAEIFRLFEGRRSQYDCFQELKAGQRTTVAAWAGRMLSWTCMFSTLYGWLSPLLLARIGGLTTGLVCFLGTLVISTAILSAQALLPVIAAAFVVALPLALNRW